MAPFDSVHSVIPASGRTVVFTIVPRGGRRVHERLPGRGVHVRLEPLRRGGLDDRRELRLIGQDDAGRFRRGHDHEPVLVGEPVAGERVDLGAA